MHAHALACEWQVLLFDQRYWGRVCAEKNVGPQPTHISDLHRTCVRFVDDALDPEHAWSRTAKTLTWGDEKDDGVATNAEAFRALLEDQATPPIRPHAKKTAEAARQPEPLM